MVELGHLGASDRDGFYNWCSANVTRILRDCGIPVPDIFTVNGKLHWASVALVQTWKDYARSIGAWKLPGDSDPGDILVFNWNGDQTMDHIGIELDGKGVWDSAEGNRSNQEWIGDRGVSTIAGAIDLEKLANSLRLRTSFERALEVESMQPSKLELEAALGFFAYGRG
jgi:hypothetical protein